MLRKSIRSSAKEPSFFYLMMAESCFQRAASTRHPEARGTLREPRTQISRRRDRRGIDPRAAGARCGELRRCGKSITSTSS